MQFPFYNDYLPHGLPVLSRGFLGQSPASRGSDDVEDAGRGWRRSDQTIQLVGVLHAEGVLRVEGVLHHHLEI